MTDPKTHPRPCGLESVPFVVTAKHKNQICKCHVCFWTSVYLLDKYIRETKYLTVAIFTLPIACGVQSPSWFYGHGMICMETVKHGFKKKKKLKKELECCL